MMYLHLDAHEGDRVFWFTTTGWMMWNFLVSVLLTEAAIVLFDGSPGTPDLNRLWDLAEGSQMTCFGTSASYIAACMKAEIEPTAGRDLAALRAVGSTGSPLAPAGFEWVYEHVGRDTWLFSASGGTDVCTAFVGGCPVLPVYQGELQARALGADLHAFDERGEPVIGAVGELVLTQPMPSMPLGLWGDEDGSRLREAYFDTYPGVWRHGDWIRITPRGSAVIYGRSDSTINRGGVRMARARSTAPCWRWIRLSTRWWWTSRGRRGELDAAVRRPARGRRARRRAHRGDPQAHPPGLLPPPCPERGGRHPRGAADTLGQAARGAGQAHPHGGTARAGGEPRLAGQPGRARLLRRAGRPSVALAPGDAPAGVPGLDHEVVPRLAEADDRQLGQVGAVEV
jgi:hypothetical protein